MGKKYLYLLLGVFVVFSSLYFITRLYNLTALPIFTDEAIYVRWAQIAKNDANWRFISLTDGKQPSFVWIAMTLMKFVSDPLLAGRLVSVLAGMATMIGLFFTGRELFKNWKIGVIASSMYLVYPMSLVYDRMALYDSLVAMFFVWALYFEVLLARYVRLDIALILGMIIGGGMLTKTNTFFSIPLLAASLFLFDFQQKHWRRRLLTWAGYALVATFIAFAMYAILRLSPFYHIIEEKNAIFVYPIGEWVHHPTQFLLSNMRGLFDWLVTYMTIPWGLLVAISLLKPSKTLMGFGKELLKTLLPFAFLVFLLFIIGQATGLKDFFPEMLPFVTFAFVAVLVSRSFFINREHLGEKVLLLLWFSLPFVYLATFGKTIYPRFIFLMTMPLLLLAAYGFWQMAKELKRQLAIVGLGAIFLVMPLWMDTLILTDFGHAPLPYPDLSQYSNDWPSGAGVKESAAFFKEQAKHGPLFIATEGTFGLMPTAYEIYLGEEKNISIKGFWPIEDKMPQEIIEASQKIPTYVIFYQPCVPCGSHYEPPKTWVVEKIAQYKKGYGDSFMHIYRVPPQLP